MSDPNNTTLPADQRFAAAQQAADAQIANTTRGLGNNQATADFINRIPTATDGARALGRGMMNLWNGMAVATDRAADVSAAQAAIPPAAPPALAKATPAAQPDRSPAASLPTYSFTNPSGVFNWAPQTAPQAAPVQPSVATPQPAGVAVYRGATPAPSYEGAPGAGAQNGALANLAAIAQMQRDSARVTADDMGQRLTVAAMNHPELAPEILQNYGASLTGAMRGADALPAAGAGLVNTNTEAAASLANNAANNVTARRAQDFDYDIQRSMPRAIGTTFGGPGGMYPVTTFASINNPVPMGSGKDMNTAQMIQGWRAANPGLSPTLTDEQVVEKLQALQQPTVTR